MSNLNSALEFGFQKPKILNPRPQHQAQELSHMIQTAGGIAVELPTIEIQGLALDWLNALPTLSKLQTAIFLSPNAVIHFFAGLKTQSITWPADLPCIAMGQGTAATLAAQKVIQITTPNIADSEHLLALPALQNIKDQSILLISGEQGRSLVSNTVLSRGAKLINLVVYRRTRPMISPKLTHALWENDGIDILVMLSQEAIENLFALFEEDAKNWLQSKPWVVISPRLVEIAKNYQVKKVILATYDHMVTTLKELIDEYGRNKRA